MQKDFDKYINYPVEEGPVKLLKMQVMHGANFFSAGPVIYMRIDLGPFDEVYSNAIEGFYEKLSQSIPSLYQHHCSPGVPGGFFKRVKEGTLLGHIMEHIAIEFQTMAGMDVGYGKTRSTLEKGVYNVCFRFFDDIAGCYAGKTALNLINAILLNKVFDIQEVVNNLIELREKRLLGPSTQAIVDEIERRKIPYIRLDAYNLVQLGTGKYQKSIRATITSDTNFIAVETADNKYLTNKMLEDAGLPVLKTALYKNIGDVLLFHKENGKAVAIKPPAGYLGQHISLELNTEEEITDAFNTVSTVDEEVLVQTYHNGASYRLLVIDYKLCAAALLKPPYIVGNGTDTIETLISNLNEEPERTFGDKGKLSKVEIDDITLDILRKHNLTLNSILSKDTKLNLKYSGNMRLGGSSTDVTDSVHPFNKFLAERAAKVIGLNVAGIDILSSDISIPMLENGAVFLEVNSAPDFRMHLNPTFNKTRPVAKYLTDMLFPPNTQTRVPVFSITGSSGKTATVEFLNYCLTKEGFTVGLATTKGLYIDNKKLKEGDMSNPESVSLVVKDPTIDCAVLETSLEGILRRGLGYKYADFGIVLNIADEHLGKDDMESMEDIAYAKSVVAEEVFSSGYSVLNADQALILEMADRIYSKPAYFSQNKKDNKTLQKHILNGGLAVCLENEIIKVYNKQNQYEILSVNDVPFLAQNNTAYAKNTVLAIVTTLTAFGIHPDNIRNYLNNYPTL